MWSISTHGIAHINNLAQAEAVWDAAKPWRDERVSYRPLDSRRMHHKRLVKLSGNKGYECVLFNTAMVTYLADGSVKLRCHGSVSSSAFARCIAPKGCGPISHKGYMFWRVTTDDGDCYYGEGSEPLHLRPTPSGKWLLVNEAAEQTEWAFDRKLGAQARKLIAPYNLWYTIIQRVGIELPTYENPKDFEDQHIADLLNNPDDAETIARLAPSLGPPINARNSAYLHLGARFRTPVPSYRLPRN